jgi:hypothetical protein
MTELVFLSSETSLDRPKLSWDALEGETGTMVIGMLSLVLRLIKGRGIGKVVLILSRDVGGRARAI